MSSLLSAQAVDEALAGMPGWVREDDGITRTWEVKGFDAAVQLVNVIAFVVNRLNHHPDILLHEYTFRAPRSVPRYANKR